MITLRPLPHWWGIPTLFAGALWIHPLPLLLLSCSLFLPSLRSWLALLTMNMTQASWKRIYPTFFNYENYFDTRASYARLQNRFEFGTLCMKIIIVFVTVFLQNMPLLFAIVSFFSAIILLGGAVFMLPAYEKKVNYVVWEKERSKGRRKAINRCL